MQRNTGYFPTESLEPSGNRLFSRSALNEGYLFRGSLGRLYMLGIQQATKMHQKKPEFHSYGPDMDLEQRQTQTGSSVRYRS